MKRVGRPRSPHNSAFGARLCRLRQCAGLTQKEVAVELGISQPAYALWELNDVSVKPAQLLKLAEILGVQIAELMGETETVKRKSGPTGKARRVFEAVSVLPRNQQSKIVDVVEAFIAQYETNSPG